MHPWVLLKYEEDGYVNLLIGGRLSHVAFLWLKSIICIVLNIVLHKWMFSFHCGKYLIQQFIIGRNRVGRFLVISPLPFETIQNSIPAPIWNHPIQTIWIEPSEILLAKVSPTFQISGRHKDCKRRANWEELATLPRAWAQLTVTYLFKIVKNKILVTTSFSLSIT